LQPFDGGRKRPERHWLSILGELWNADKHRQIQLVGATIGVKPFRLDFSKWTAPDRSAPRYRTVFRRALGPFQDGAELARIEFFDRVNPMELDAYMQMELPITFDIEFASGPPAYGGRVVETLQLLKDRTMALLVKFEPSLR
jgi:hypothetical protein